jgi:hypothetical protein
MSKHPRHQTVISRNADENIGEDHWLKQFEKNLQKGAVQPRQIEDTLYYQINSIMNGKSKYPSVDAAVEDMMQRSGLNDYLHKVKVSDQTAVQKKTADDNDAMHKKVEVEKVIPVVIKKCPDIQHTIENYIRDTKGNISVPAIISKIQGIHRNDVSDAQDWEDDDLIRFVSKLNLEAKKNNPAAFENFSNLGERDSQTSDSEIDPSNLDAFHSLNPVKF